MEYVRRAIVKAKQQETIEKAKQQETNSYGQPAHNSGLDALSLPNTAKTAADRIDIANEALEKQRVIAGLPDHRLADAFRILRTQVLNKLSARQASTLAITSARRSEGKTLISANLAVSFAMHVNRTVLLVEVDLRTPDIARKFSIQPTYGLTDYLLDDVPLAECICHPGFERLSLLSAGKPQSNSSELLSAPKMRELVRDLKSRYAERIVIFDLPPLLTGDDALSFLNDTEACLLVIAEGAAPRRDLQRAIDLISPELLIGTVLNKSSDTQQLSDYYPVVRK